MLLVRNKCVLFLLTVCLHISVELEQGQADFNSLYNFVVELRNSSDSMLEFVAKVQITFCPELPICDQEEGALLKKHELMKTLPTILVTENRTIPIEDIPEFLGVCCLPCSCAERCHENDNCCPTRNDLNNYSQRAKNDNETDKETTKTQCIIASVKSYYTCNNYGLSSYRRYFMVNNCYVNASDTATRRKCENPDATNLDETGPVTSVRTGRTYWNIHCANCNSDGDNILDWNMVVKFKGDFVYYSNELEIMGYPKTVEELHNRLVQMGTITYKPPEHSTVEHMRCLMKSEVLSCERDKETEKTYGSRLFFDSCQQFYNPVMINMYPYLNIFCFFCREDRMHSKRKKDCDWDSDKKFGTNSMTAILDYRTYGSKHNRRLIATLFYLPFQRF